MTVCRALSTVWFRQLFALLVAIVMALSVHAQGPSREMWKAPNNKTYVVTTMGGGKMFMFSEQGVGNIFMHTTSGENRILTQGALTQTDADELMKAYLAHVSDSPSSTGASPSVPASGTSAVAATPDVSVTSVALDASGNLVAQTTKGPQTFTSDGEHIIMSMPGSGVSMHTLELEYRSAAKANAKAFGTSLATFGNKGTFASSGGWFLMKLDNVRYPSPIPVSKKTVSMGDEDRHQESLLTYLNGLLPLLRAALDKAKADPSTSAVAVRYGTLSF